MARNVYPSFKLLEIADVDLNDDCEGDFLGHTETLIGKILFEIPKSQDLIPGEEVLWRFQVS